jgi:DNA-binding CsgD family transcriptional regulator
MTWPTSPTDKQLLNNANLTPRQREFFKLRAAGCGIRTIARAYKISPTSVRDTLEAADRKIDRAKGEAA